MSEGMRVGDAEREQASAALAEHFAAGRLDDREHAERLDAAWSARTRADLDQLFWDLPPLRPVAVAPPARARRGPRLPLVPITIVLIVLSVILDVPLWIGAILLWVNVCKRGCRSRSGHGRPPQTRAHGWAA